jgi:hypothetical protein
MRELTVDRARDGAGGLVGTLVTSGDSAPYEVPPVARERLELSPEEARELEELRSFATRGDGKQTFDTVCCSRMLFLKLAEVWR